MTRAARATSTTGNAARRSARPSATVVAVLLTVGLLSACSGAERPQEDPGPTTTAPPDETSASPTPSATEDGVEKPERPAAMDKKNADGAAAAAEYYISLYPYVMTTGDTSTWKAMSFKTCGFCKSSIDQAERINDEKFVWSGGEITQFDVATEYARDEATGIYPFDARITQNAGHIRDGSGEAVFDGKATDDLYRIEVGNIDGDWTIVEIAKKP
ncbi:DUF6318 family protein [Isoptericola cucumis]|uniref:DUF6318 family protein n=1 Tax=Isoptericola cucumis TaxID=1776856 RepID=UPI00320AE3FB